MLVRVTPYSKAGLTGRRLNEYISIKRDVVAPKAPALFSVNVQSELVALSGLRLMILISTIMISDTRLTAFIHRGIVPNNWRRLLIMKHDLPQEPELELI